MTAENGKLRLGLVGAGAFGEFCMRTYARMDDLEVVAIADIRREAAASVADALGAKSYDDASQLIRDENVDLVHIATPPSSHYELVLQCARAGKHVLCEKPLAMSTSEAQEMLAAMKDKGLIAPVNFVLRYNAVSDAVKAVLESGVLGKVLSANLTNCASDSRLGVEHWFWDKSVGGGIFIEHGVHFFDLYRYWLGAGEMVSATAAHRENTGQEDRVTCLVRHGTDGALATHYHGFDQPAMLDRTSHRLVCELGDIRVEGWIPLVMEVDAVVDDAGAQALSAACPKGRIEVVETYDGELAKLPSRGTARNVSQRVRLRYCPDPDKQGVYSRSVHDLMADQLAYLRDHSHERVITEENGYAAVALAEAAVKKATG
jgi:predicted dehydrogenase